MTAPGNGHPVALDPAGPRELLLERLESGALELPLMPDTVAAVLEACRGDDAGARQVAETMQRDPALAGHVLRTANSAAYAGSEPIVSLPQAVSRMGLSTVAEITLAVALRARVFSVPRFEAVIQAVWRHAATSGAWGREIARRRRRNVEGAFLCGLLHDVGRPVILQTLVDFEQSLKRRFGDESILAVADELHPRIGAALVRDWGLPAWMVEAIAFHHDWAAAGEHRDEAATTAFADELARWTLDASAVDADALRGSPLAGELGFYPEDLEELMSAREHVREVAEVLS